MGKDDISMEGTMETQEVIHYLEGLIEGFREGRIVVEQGERYLTLNPPKTLGVEIEARRKKDKEKLSLELSWHKTAEESEGKTLKISSKEPEIEAAEAPVPDQGGGLP